MQRCREQGLYNTDSCADWFEDATSDKGNIPYPRIATPHDRSSRIDAARIQYPTRAAPCPQQALPFTICIANSMLSCITTLKSEA